MGTCESCKSASAVISWSPPISGTRRARGCMKHRSRVLKEGEKTYCRYCAQQPLGMPDMEAPKAYCSACYVGAVQARYAAIYGKPMQCHVVMRPKGFVSPKRRACSRPKPNAHSHAA